MMMTVAAIVVGLLLIMLGHGAGWVVLRRIAGPMIGGLITTVFLTLMVIASYSCYGGVVASMAELLQPAVFQNSCRNNMG